MCSATKSRLDNLRQGEYNPAIFTERTFDSSAGETRWLVGYAFQLRTEPADEDARRAGDRSELVAWLKHDELACELHTALTRHELGDDRVCTTSAVEPKR